MKYFRFTVLSGMLVSIFFAVSSAQPPTTAKTFRMYTDATHSVSITAGASAGTGTFMWPQPAIGIFKSDIAGVMSLSAINLSPGSSDITGSLSVTNGGTGNNVVGSAGSVAFSDGTKINYTAVGVTSQILLSGGSGAPTWTNTLPSGTNVPFSLITTGVNTQATMTVSTGASIVPSGSGLIRATAFTGAGSITDAVDLATTEVNGTLGISNGGTGNTVAGGAGAVAYSDGSKITYTTPGTTGQILQSNGSGAPSWISLAGQLVAKGRVAGDGVNFSYVITPGGTIPAGATIIVTLESAANAAITVTSRTGTTFTVQAPFILSPSDFINYLIF